jgi:YD repeat-containing protein
VFQSGSFFDFKAELSDYGKIYLRNVYTTEVATPVTTFSPATITITDVLQRDSKYSSTASQSFLFAGGQPVEIKNRTGNVTSYIWGFNNTLPIVKGDGIEFSTLLTAYNASPENIRTNVLAVNPQAQITTYTHKLTVGIVSVKDANEQVITYEYDKLGRLILKRDSDGKVLEQYTYTYQH